MDGTRLAEHDAGGPDPRAKPARPKYEVLVASGWHVRLGQRLLIEQRKSWTDRRGYFRTKKTHYKTGPLVAFAAVLAWRDRGPIWGRPGPDGRIQREFAQTPPGGWAALAGVSPKTWKGYRDAALQAGLLCESEGAPPSERARRNVPLLRPAVDPVEEGEQHARIPVQVMPSRPVSG